MTNEETREVLQEQIDKYGQEYDEKGIEALNVAIKVLDQQPCEDCISREDILDAIETWDKFGVNAEQKLIRWQDHYVPYVHLDDVRNAIANMLSVTPQRLKGKWVSAEHFDEIYGKAYDCSNCGHGVIGTPNYCPNCGADMRGDT